MINSVSQEEAKLLTPYQIAAYLNDTGWHEDGVLGNVAQIWHRKEPKWSEFEIMQPLSQTLKDYHPRVKELIFCLSEFEGRKAQDVLKDISEFYSDVIRVRVIHDDVEGGTIPLSDGVLLIKKAKELLLSAAKSTFSKKKYFASGALSEELVRFVDQLRLGQTERGSYIVNLLAPIEAKIDKQEDISSTSVSRAVTKNLARSLHAIDESVERFKETRNLTAFDSAVEKGVSANLCDALIGLSGEALTRDVNISLSLSRSEPEEEELPLTYILKSDQLKYLEEASNYFKEIYILNDKTISGSVVKLSHLEGEEVGIAVITTDVNGFDRNVSVELPLDEYWRAHEAHGKSENVEVTGDLHISPRSAKLLNWRDFKVIGNQDLFEGN